MNTEFDQSKLDGLIDALIAWGASSALIIDHMARAAAAGHGEGTPAESLDRVLRSALRGLEDRYAAMDLALAADVLADVIETVGRKVFLVDLEAEEA